MVLGLGLFLGGSQGSFLLVLGKGSRPSAKLEVVVDLGILA